MHNHNAKVEKADYPGCFSVPEGPVEQENTDENKRLWRGGVVGRGLGYNLASGTTLHCLFQESADSTEPGAQLHIRPDTQTRTEAGFKELSHPTRRKGKKKRFLIKGECKDAVFGPTSTFP